MKIKINDSLSELANMAITSIMMVLRDLFVTYDQYTSIEEAEKTSNGPVVMPIVAFEPKRIHLKTKSAKYPLCNVRYSVYSKQPESPVKCNRFILEKRHISRDELIKQLPPTIQHGAFDIENDYTFDDLLRTLEGIKSDRVFFFYNQAPSETVVTHCVAVIHEFGEESNPYCVATVYLSIEVNK